MLSLIFTLILTQQIEEQMEVRLVEMDVRVIDLRHRPVPGLSRDLFKVEENRKKRAIEHFEEISYLDMEPGEAFESPRLLILFNFMESPVKVQQYIDRAEEYLLYKDTGAWQVAIGTMGREGGQIITPFTHEQTEWVEGILRTRETYAQWKDRTLYVTGNAKETEDVTKRESGEYGFEINTNPGGTSAEEGANRTPAMVSPFGNKEEQFAEKQSPSLELDPRMLTRFIHLLTTYDGIKEVLILGPELWSFQEESEEHWIRQRVPEYVRPQALASVGSGDRVGRLNESEDATGFDLQQVLTHCIKNKIRLNRLEITQKTTDGLISATGGDTYACNGTGIPDAIDRFLDRAGHMYRIRYATEVARNDLKYRGVKIGVKGLTHITEHVNRYYPRLLIEENQLHARLDADKQNLTFHYALPWKSLYFERSNQALRAQLAVSQRVYLDHRLVFENVRVFQPTKPKAKQKHGNQGNDHLTVDFDLPIFEEGVYRVEFTSVDLLNGKRSAQSIDVSL